MKHLYTNESNSIEERGNGGLFCTEWGAEAHKVQGYLPRHPERGHLRVIGADPPLLLRLANEGPLRLGHGPGTTGILLIRVDDGILPESLLFLI